jgi:hypothetical protein
LQQKHFIQIPFPLDPDGLKKLAILGESSSRLEIPAFWYVAPGLESESMGIATKSAKQLAKEQAERANFDAFRSAHPDFASRALVTCETGGDPPDILCVDEAGGRIGVELVQWINEEQTALSKERFKAEGSYTQVIRSWEAQPPEHIGFVFISAKEKTMLRPADTAVFRTELYAFVTNKDTAWLENPEWDDLQGWRFNDFTGFPMLGKHLAELHCYSRGRRFSPSPGSDWIQFHAHGGAYTSDWMRDALVDNVRAKVAKYMSPTGQQKLQQEKLDEFYLLAYYDEAVLHNTPYHTLTFGFVDAAAAVAAEMSVTAHPFDKVFLFSPIEKAQKTIQLWPIR